MTLIAPRHADALAPYDDFTFALADAPATPVAASLSLASNCRHARSRSTSSSTPAVTYHAVDGSSRCGSIRAVPITPPRRLHFTSFTVNPRPTAPSPAPGAPQPNPAPILREDLVHVLRLLLARYAEAADLAAEIASTAEEPLGKPDAAWCAEMHGRVKEVAKRRLEMARTFNRELMRLSDLERIGHAPRSWKTFTKPSAKRHSVGPGPRRRVHSMPPRTPTLDEDLDSPSSLSRSLSTSTSTSTPLWTGGIDPDASLSPLRRPALLPLHDVEAPDDTDWTGSMQCGQVHFVSEWVFRITRLILASGFSGAQETADTRVMESTRAELAQLQRHMGLLRSHCTSPGQDEDKPPPYPKKWGAGAPATPRRPQLSRTRSTPLPAKPSEKEHRHLDGRLSRFALCQYIRRLFIGA